jgi:hypothetical protein
MTTNQRTLECTLFSERILESVSCGDGGVAASWLGPKDFEHSSDREEASRTDEK